MRENGLSYPQIWEDLLCFPFHPTNPIASSNKQLYINVVGKIKQRLYSWHLCGNIIIKKIFSEFRVSIFNYQQAGVL